MYGWIHRKIKAAYEKKIDSTGLALFRIFYSAFFLCEVLQLTFYKHLVFDYVPYVNRYEMDFGPALFVWALSVFCIMIGFYTRIACIVNYIFTLTFISTITTFEYHMFYTYVGINFMLMFLPLNKALSADRIITRVKYSNARFTYNPETKVSVLAYYLPVYMGIALFYFDSVLYKLDSPTWLSGLGMWKPSVIPHFNHYGESFLLNSKWLALTMGYVTLVFEAVFIFLFWFRPFRWPFFILGWLLHIGIYVFFPIPWFAFGVMAIYLLLVPASFWKKAGSLFKANKQNLIFIYDGDCPLCNRTRIVISGIDVFQRIKFITVREALLTLKETEGMSAEALESDIYSINKQGVLKKGLDTYIRVLFNLLYTFPFALILMIPGIYHIGKWVYRRVADNRIRTKCTDETCGLPTNLPHNPELQKITRNYSVKDLRITIITLFFIGINLLQLLVSIDSGIIKKYIDGTPVEKVVSATSGVTAYSKIFLGITHHGLFVDPHMKGYNHIVSIVYKDKTGKEQWLPVIDKNGQPGPYNTGPNWARWTFRSSSPKINNEMLFKGIRDFTAFWIGRNGLGFDRQDFIIRVKKIMVPSEWSKNFLTRQLSNPWIDAGTATWNNKKFSIHLDREIEQI